MAKLGSGNKQWMNGVNRNRSRGKKSSKKNKGCYIATCVYGTYECPEVWVLRRFRDDILDSSWYGKLFIKIYYIISPLAVSLFGTYGTVKKVWKRLLDAFVKKLMQQGFDNSPYND